MLERNDCSGLFGKAHSGLLALSLILVTGLPLSAAGPLDLIPADATAIVRLSTPEATISQVGNFANAVQPGLGFMVQGQAPGLGKIISNNTLGGVDLKQDWYVAVFAVKNAEPAVVFLIPSTDTDALQQAVGEDFGFATKDSWVAYSKDEAVMELVEGCLDGSSESVTSTIDERSTKIVTDSSVGIWVNVAEIAKSYSTELDAADEQLDIVLQGLSAQIPATPGLNIAAIMDMYADLGHGALQVVRDSEAFTLGVTVSNDKITIDELLVVGARTKTDECLSSQKTSRLDVLNRLPQNKHGYMALYGDMSGLMEWGMGFATSMLGDNTEAKEKLETMIAGLKDVEFGDQGWAFSVNESQDASGLFEAFVVSYATPAAKMREIALQMGDAYKLELPGVKQEITVTRDAEQYGDRSADIIRMKQEFDAENNPAAEMQKKLQELLHGKDGMTQRLVVLDNATIQTIGGNQDTMKEALAAFDRTDTTTQSDNQTGRDGLLEQANLVGMIDLPNLAITAVKAVAASGQLPIPIQADQLDGLSVPRSYLGFSAGVEPQGVRLKTQIPAKTLNGFFQIFTFFQMMQQQQRQ